MYEPPEFTSFSFNRRSTVSTGQPLALDKWTSISSGWLIPSMSGILSERLARSSSRRFLLCCTSSSSSLCTLSRTTRSASPTTSFIPSSRFNPASVIAAHPHASTRTRTIESSPYRAVPDESPARAHTS
uniref:Uncharacterized protein n=1 Tax=uncultured marine microorganism HF4000_APKG8D23 TaxID=455554 RepID=B3TAJ0_9ZZZZ|nr:hypothetical protein ALOHA_HF4000APKG8D23ctg1g17 [uncultured marine microorganism HF4000_APKG8D23]